MRYAVDRLDHLVITCGGVTLLRLRYQRVLGMEVAEFGPHDRTALKFGGQKINLRRRRRPSRNGSPAPPAACPAPTTFASSSPSAPSRWSPTCRIAGWRSEQGPVAKDGALGPITSVYCRDPDGNLIEIATYGSLE